MKWAIREKIGAGFGLVLLSLVVIAVVSYRSTAQLIETVRIVSQTHRLLEALEIVRAHLSDIEAEARGYVISGDDRYLEPYYGALVEIAQHISDLGALAADQRDQEDYVETLKALVEGKVALVRKMIALRQQGGGETAQQMVLMDQGKVVMDTIRVVIIAATNEGRALHRQRDEEAYQSASSTIMTIAVGSLLALGIAAGATIIINRDITSLRRTEAALRRSEELYHTLVKNFPNGTVRLFDDELRYTIADGAGFATLGLSKEAIEGKTIWEVWPPETCAIIEPHYRAALAGEVRSFEVPYVNRIYQVYVMPIRIASGEIVAGMVVSHDITERKEVDRLKDEFISTVSHELRTPLSSLRGFTELMLEREFPPERRQRFVSIMHSETVRLTNLINDFLDLQRIESGRQVYHFERVDVRELLHERIALFMPVEAQVVWHLEVPETLPLVQADRDRIRQVLANILSNALKYSPRGGEITVSARQQGAYVEVRVTDQGVGIPPEAIPQLFSKFFRVENSQTRHIGGTGLGLALVKDIVEAHQGRVWVDSEPEPRQCVLFYPTCSCATGTSGGSSGRRERGHNGYFAGRERSGLHTVATRTFRGYRVISDYHELCRTSARSHSPLPAAYAASGHPPGWGHGWMGLASGAEKRSCLASHPHHPRYHK